MKKIVRTSLLCLMMIGTCGLLPASAENYKTSVEPMKMVEITEKTVNEVKMLNTEQNQRNSEFGTLKQVQINTDSLKRNFHIATREVANIDSTLEPGDLIGSIETIHLTKGDKVKFNFSYHPSFAKLQYGILSSDNKFYNLSVTGGSFVNSISAPKSDDYVICFKNPSSETVSLTGFVSF